MVIDTKQLREQYSVGTPLDGASDIIVALCDHIDEMKDLLALCEPHIDASAILCENGECLKDAVRKALTTPANKREMECIRSG